MRGALEAISKWGRCGARGRASQARTREASGNRPALLRGSALNGWTRRGRRAAKAARIRAGTSPPSRARKHGPGDRNRRDGAPRGARVLQKGTRHTEGLVRHSVLHPPQLALGAQRKAPPGGAATTAYPAPDKNTGDDAWLFDNLIGLRGERAAISFPSPARAEGKKDCRIAKSFRPTTMPVIKIGSSGNRVDESNGKCGFKPHGYWVFEVS